MDEGPNDEEMGRRDRLRRKAAENPVRQDILRRLKPRGATITATELANESLSVTYANHHLTYLEEVGAVEVAETMHEGGKVVRVFRSTPAGAALVPVA